MRHENIDIAIVAVEQWQKRQFPKATPQGCANHLLSEARELAENPTDAREIADVFMLLIGVAQAAGVNLRTAIVGKLAENMDREWGAENAQGFIEHVRGPETDDPDKVFETYAREVHNR